MFTNWELNKCGTFWRPNSGWTGVIEILTPVEGQEETERLAKMAMAAPSMFEALRELMPPENNGWWCPTCRLAVPGQEVTYSEHHTECGTYLGAINNAEW
jgi:hypothetical protein